MPPPPQFSAGILPRHYLVLIVLAFLAIAGTVLWFWYEPNYGAGVDEASYYLAAKGLALHADPGYYNPDPLLFVPEHMVESRPGVYYAMYSIGYPLLAAAANRLGGPVAPFLVNPILTLVALVGAFLFFRFFVNDYFAGAGALILATHSAIIHFGVAALSHIPDLACATWGLYFALLWRHKPALWKIVAAGILLGYAACIRYTEVILLLPLCWLMFFRWRQSPKDWPRLRIGAHAAGAAVGWLVGLAPLLWYQTVAFGSPFRTGYGLRNESSAFTLHFFVDHLGFTLQTLCTMPSGLILLPLAVIALFLRRWVSGRDAGFLALVFLPTIFLYDAYYWMDTNEPLLYARFFIPAYPAIIAAALLPLERATQRWRPVQYAILVLLVVYASFNFQYAPPQSRFNGVLMSHEATVDLVRVGLPYDAVIVPNGFTAYSVVYYTDMSVIYPLYFSDKWVDHQLEHEAPGSGFPSHFNALREAEFRAVLGGRTQDQLFDILTNKLLTLARQGRTIGLVSQENDSQWYAFLREKFRFVALSRDESFGLTLWRLEAKEESPSSPPRKP